MTAVQRGLGRGLDALLQGYEEKIDPSSVTLIPIEEIRPNPNQPRRDFQDAAMAELAASIRSNGVLQPILVRPLEDADHRYELVAGERRWRASQLAELTDIPAMVRELGDQESLAIAMIENLQREDLNPIEEAIGLRRLQEDFGLTQEVLANKVGKSRPAIANTLRLLQLPDLMQNDIRTGRISSGHGRSLLAVTDEAARTQLYSRCLEPGLSVREAEAQVGYWKNTGHLPGQTAADPGARAGSRPKPEVRPEMAALQDRLADALGLAVVLRGDLDKGKMVFPYKDYSQLENILERLGVPLLPPDAMVAALADQGLAEEALEIAALPASILAAGSDQDEEPNMPLSTDDNAERPAAQQDAKASQGAAAVEAMLRGHEDQANGPDLGVSDSDAPGLDDPLLEGMDMDEMDAEGDLVGQSHGMDISPDDHEDRAARARADRDAKPETAEGPAQADMQGPVLEGMDMEEMDAEGDLVGQSHGMDISPDDHEDRAAQDEGDLDSELDFDDDELADLDRALDEILDETRDM